MRAERIGVVILEGGNPADIIEQQMVSVRKALTLDIIERVRDIPEIDGVYLSTNYPDLAEAATALGAVAVAETAPFHFGTRLRDVIRLHQLDGVIYVGGASSPFLSADEFREVARGLRQRKRVVYTNNVQSADFIAFTPGSAIELIELPAIDNVLANLLRSQAGLERILLPHSVGVHFDVDTPSDVLVMSLSPRLGPRSRLAIQQLDWRVDRVARAKELLALPRSRILLAGRVNPWTMSEIGTHFRCRLRVISEERGMRAMGRAEQGEVHSLLGFLLEQLSPQGLVQYISNIADAAFLDTRVIFAHLGWRLSEGQRFASDLGLVDRLEHPLLAEFTAAAFAAPIPIILGGHSLVAGSMWSLVDTLRYEAGELQPPAEYRQVSLGPGHPLVGQRLMDVAGALPGEVVALDDGVALRTAFRRDLVLQPGMGLYCRVLSRRL
jgi:hypothetical protein